MVEEENPQIDKSPVNDLEAHEELDLAKNGQVSDELLESTEASAEKGGFDVVDADITNNLATADQPDLEKTPSKEAMPIAQYETEENSEPEIDISSIDEEDTQQVKVDTKLVNEESTEVPTLNLLQESNATTGETSQQAWFSELDNFHEPDLPKPTINKASYEPLIDEGWYNTHWAAETKPDLTSASQKDSIPINKANDKNLSVSMDGKAGIPGGDDDIPTIPPPASFQPIIESPAPQPVPEVDWNATHVMPTAYPSTSMVTPKAIQPSIQNVKKQKEKKSTTQQVIQNKKNGTPNKTKGCIVRLMLAFVFIMVLVGLALGSFAVYQYYRIASSLPDVNELRARASQFETTRILDRDGNILYEIIDPNAGKRTFVPLERISPFLIAATIATEDKEYYNHPGFDPIALARALWQNYSAGEIVSGASTITQQLARMLLLPDERFEQSYQRKAREIVLASEIDRRYSKEEILELYLNEIFFGSMAYGIEAAAETYFNTSAQDLTLWQSSFLAGLPQSPADHDIFKNREGTLSRNRDVLVLMYEMSLEKNCIYIGEGLEEVCIDAVQALEAAETLEAYEFTPPTFQMKYPHWVVYIQSLLESQFDPQTIYRSGFTVFTTLDPTLQREAEQAVTQQLAALQENNASNGAVVAIAPNTGEILAMVGSADFYNEAISGQVNMALTQTRQPGSSIKPLTYIAAFEKGWTPSTLIWDVPSGFPPSGNPEDTRPAYEPVNYDGRFHGPVTLRSALANSYNIPAVKALEFVGIYDDPTTPTEDGLIAMAKRLGITSLNRADYGLSLSLGGGEASLLEMTGAYSVFANNGRRIAPVAITKIIDHSGSLIFEYEAPAGDQVIRAEHAYLMSSILSDKNARIPAFGNNPVINLPFTAAAKTGTTNDFRDNWTIGYTPDLVIGVWVGNADYTPMKNTSGLTGAAPIWAQLMQYGIQYLKGGIPSDFVRPVGIVDRVICSISGTEPSEWCPEQRSEIFASDQLPLPKKEDLWSEVEIDTWTGLIASPACADFVEEEMAINVSDPTAKRWLTENDSGKSWAERMGFPDPIFFLPERECKVSDSKVFINLINPFDGQTIRETPLDLVGVIDATSNFKDFRIEYGLGEKPEDWDVLVDWENEPYKAADKIYEWDLADIEEGTITLRITVRSTINTQAEKLITVRMAVPTPTPTPTSTPTITPTPSPTQTQTLEPTSTPTLEPTKAPTLTSTPTLEPTFTPTVVE